MSTIKCLVCGTENQTDTVKVCAQCGAVLFNPTASTINMHIDPALLRLRRVHEQDSDLNAAAHTIVLHIRGLTERLTFKEGTVIVLGRSDVGTPTLLNMDLNRYGAHERGVSREHAVLRFMGDELTITDLNSANSTSLNFHKLVPSSTTGVVRPAGAGHTQSP
ncbi:MAG: FHA domain-containing protein, partial [Chloroflexota bacterium]